ncbi:MAG: GerAB/ArcD/ProY family transporter [Christensenellaceae bacterium]|nr:GerAB/ArcD/ProY family transporter [Christensenellaceae bacterium]
MKLITTRQACFMLILAAITFKLMFLPALLSGAVNNDTPVAVLFLGTLELMAPIVLLWLSHKYPDMTFKEMLIKMFGNVVAKIILILFSVHFLMRTIAVFVGYYLYLYFTLYSALQWITFAIPLLIVLFYIITMGLRSIGRLMEIFVPIVLAAIVAVLIFASIPADFSNMLPIFENGVISSTVPALDYTLWAGNFLVYVMVMGNIKRSKNHNRAMILTLLITVVLIIAFYVIYASLFHYNAGNYSESNSDIVSILPRSSDVASIHWIIAIIWCSAMFLYCVVVGVCSQFCAQEAIGTKYKWQIGMLICIIILAVAAGINFDIAKLAAFGIRYGKYFDYLVQFIIPFMLWIFAFRLKSDRSGAKTDKAQNPLDSNAAGQQKFRTPRRPQGRERGEYGK